MNPRRPTPEDLKSCTHDILSEFEDFCKVDLQLKGRTPIDHVRKIKRFLDFIKKNPQDITDKNIRNYLKQFEGKAPSTYKNALASLKRFFRDFMNMEDIVSTFKFPETQINPRKAPNKQELQAFYKALKSPMDRSTFLMYASSGLRKNELLLLERKDIDPETRMITPRKARNETKNVPLFTFYNEEAERELNAYLSSRMDTDPRLYPIGMHRLERIFEKVSKETGIKITPQKLREWFCCEMGEIGVPDRYVDAFCGRVPQSILARHYTDYNPERLKQIYDKAGLKVLN